MDFSQYDKSDSIMRGKNVIVLQNLDSLDSKKIIIELSTVSSSTFNYSEGELEQYDNLDLTAKVVQACLREYYADCIDATTEAAVHMPMYTPLVITVDSVPYHFDDIADFLQRKDTLPFSVDTDVLKLVDICADATIEAAFHMPMYTPFVITMDSVPYHFDDIADFLQRKDTLPFSIDTDVLKLVDICADATFEAAVKLEIDQPFSITFNSTRYVFENINDFISKYRDVFGVEIQPTLFVPETETLICEWLRSSDFSGVIDSWMSMELESRDEVVFAYMDSLQQFNFTIDQIRSIKADYFESTERNNILSIDFSPWLGEIKAKAKQQFRNQPGYFNLSVTEDYLIEDMSAPQPIMDALNALSPYIEDTVYYARVSADISIQKTVGNQYIVGVYPMIEFLNHDSESVWFENLIEVYQTCFKGSNVAAFKLGHNFESPSPTFLKQSDSMLNLIEGTKWLKSRAGFTIIECYIPFVETPPTVISCDGATDYVDFAILLRDGTDPSILDTEMLLMIDGEVIPLTSPLPNWLRIEEGAPFPYDIPNEFIVLITLRYYNLGDVNRRVEFKSLSDDIQVFTYNNPTSVQLSSDNSHAGACLSEASEVPEVPEDPEDPEDPSSGVAFNNFLMTPIDDNTVRVTFTNPQANYDLSQYWIVYRSNTPFQSAPTQAQVWDNKSGISNGTNTYDVTGTPGSTYYLALALASTGDISATTISPIAYITVTIPEVVVQNPVQKVDLTLQLSSNGTGVGGVFTNPNNPLEFSYYRVWTRDIAPPMTSIDQATETWYTMNSSPQWDMSNIFRNVEVGVPYSVAVALVGQDTQTPVSDITYVTYTKMDVLGFNMPSISLDPVDVREFSSTVNTNNISAIRGGWFDTNGNLWGYGIKGPYNGPYLAEYILNTPFDVGSVASQTHRVFDFNIGTIVENILTVNFINGGTVAIVEANSPTAGTGRFMIARVCDTPYNLMSSINNPNIECSELSTLMSTWNNPPISINPENNKLHSVTNNKNLNEVTLTYTPGVSTRIEVSGLKTKEMTSIIHHAIWDSNVTVTGIQIGTDGTRLIITQSNWGEPVKKSRILQFLTTTPFEFNSGVTLVDYSLDPFGSGRVDLFLSLNSPTYHPHSKFNNKPALLLISQEPIRIVQRGYTLT